MAIRDGAEKRHIKGEKEVQEERRTYERSENGTHGPHPRTGVDHVHQSALYKEKAEREKGGQGNRIWMGGLKKKLRGVTSSFNGTDVAKKRSGIGTR